jgi:3-(3-hydroxy-phenyl)propionate hydroxylase
MLAELGLKDEAFADDASGGLQSPIFHFRDRVSGELVAVFDLNLLKDEVPYPFVVQWEQYKLVRAAQPRIEGSGIAEVRFSTKVTGLVQSADHVDVTVINAGGETETVARALRHRHRWRPQHRAAPGRHRVRGLHLGRAFHQDRHQFRFRRDRRGFCTRNYFSDPNEWLNLFKVVGDGPPGYWRGIMPVPAEESDEQA